MKRIKSGIKKYMTYFMKKPVSASLLLALILGLGGAFVSYFVLCITIAAFPRLITGFFQIALVGVLIGLFVVYPLILSLINLVILFFPKKRMAFIELITLLWGGFCTAIYMPFCEIMFSADWNIQLQNAEKHTPIFTQAVPTVIILICVAAAGYLVLSFVPLKKLPPLVTVLCFSALYLGMAVAVVWAVQIWVVIFACLYAVNCILVMLKLMQYKILEWTDMQQTGQPDFARLQQQTQKESCTDSVSQSVTITEAESEQPAEAEPVPIRTDRYSNPFLNACHHFLMKSSNWPVAALVLALPLLGVLIGILVLFGQQPDALVRAWTETSDWTLSAQTAPQNLIVDEHYLCTVAAGGHRRIVKPLRMGERHGHAVIVNRQLMIANAFEQLLEERTPRFHRHLRHFYDTYGFPIAKLIRSRFAADIVYFIMKPLEWLFLIVLYLFDVKPENRIAVQYLPKQP